MNVICDRGTHAPCPARCPQVIGRINNQMQQLDVRTTLGAEEFSELLGDALAELQEDGGQ